MAANSNLKRDIQPMRDDVHKALQERGLTGEYDGRPAYQRDDYLG
jgi:hypothetical protein